MRIAVLARGPMRPDIPSVNARLSELRWTFESFGHEVHVYVATWTEHLSELAQLMEPARFLLEEGITAEVVSRLTPVERLPRGASMLNAVRQYTLAKTATAWVRDSGTYDFVAHGRTDLKLGLGGSVDSWLVEGTYATIHTHHENAFLNDQFSVAQPDLMARAWDNGSMEDVVRKLEAVEIPELVLQQNIDRQGIPVALRPTSLWQLDQQRHVATPS